MQQEPLFIGNPDYLSTRHTPIIELVGSWQVYSDHDTVKWPRGKRLRQVNYAERNRILMFCYLARA